ncbi:hypothetical protein [Bdellovibrio sp. NC01]|uniref:hypothetical protein n=1 Tax=Bdellovibrio sp. NC01 TaxID=2220073 RepID=UPI00115B8D75|nr:hypothetical protein [Bdellovibrio sp. NC01]QDK37715.1 hypothetical protein DOE51_09025 [Bdellovibrio sp. NC01]
MNLKAFILSVLFFSLPTIASAEWLCSEIFETQPSAAQIRTALLSTQGTDRLHFLRPSYTPPIEMNEYPRLVNESYQHIVAIDGGSVLFHGNIFAEGYFRQTRLGKPQATAPSTQSLIETQTWFQWDGGKFTEQKTLPQIELLRPFIKDGFVTLYRGLNREQVQQMKSAKAGAAQSLNELFPANRDALFFTPDYESARKWSKGYVAEIKVAVEDLKNIYTGIEYDYVEVAIPSGDVILKALQTLKVKKTQAP